MPRRSKLKLGLHRVALEYCFSRALEHLSSRSQLLVHVPSAPHKPSATSYSDSSTGTLSLSLHTSVMIPIGSFSRSRLSRDSTAHSTLPYSTSSPLDVSQPAVSLVNFRNRLGALLHMPGSLCPHSRYRFPCCSKPSLVTLPSRTA